LEVDRLRRDLESRDVVMKSAKGAVCTALNKKYDISIVEPVVWNETCARQGSWYRASERNGLYLVVSSFHLDGYENCKSATITDSDFKLLHPAGLKEKQQLVKNNRFRGLIPSEWRQVKEIEKKIFLRWARRLGSAEEDFEFLYLSHTANHANFIEPQFYIKEKGEIIPYSIDRSAHLCSSCLELFQVLGEKYHKKLVAPCPGAIIFAGLRPDQFFLVDSSG
jgi:hypothetical protein